MTASVSSPEVLAFVAAVRRELDDLGADEIDELTGGLEADLDDALADSATGSAGAGVERFGTPAAYAAELRAAAGLPPRAARGGRRGAGVRLRAAGRRFTHWLQSRPWWPPIRDFLITLRPVWWVTRAGVVALVPAGGFGGGFVLWFLILAVISVEIGRRRLAERGKWRRALVAVANTICALALVPALSSAAGVGSAYTEVVAVPPQDGLWLNGEEVRNVLPYDSEGRPLADVQLFDQNGAPLSVGTSARTPIPGPNDTMQGQVPSFTDRSLQVWNAYPLRQVPMRDAGGFDPQTGNPIGEPVGDPVPPDRPGPPVPRLAQPSAAAPSPSASASPSR